MFLIRGVAQTVMRFSRAPQKVGRKLSELLPKVMQSLEDQDDEELRESVLQTLEKALLKCPREVTPFVQSINDLATVMIRHDPVRTL